MIELTGSNLDHPARKLNGTISEAKGRYLTISSPEEIAPSSSIRVQGKDLLFLGDILHSDLGPDGKWSVQMSVKSKIMIF